MDVLEKWFPGNPYFLAALAIIIVIVLRLGRQIYNDRDGKQRRALVLRGPGYVGIPLFVWRDGLRQRWVNDTHWRVLGPTDPRFRWVWSPTGHPYRLTRGKVVGNAPWIIKQDE